MTFNKTFWLFAIILVSCILLDLNYKRWTKNEGVIGNDIHHYYGYLPALFIYNDIKLEKSNYQYGDDLYYFWSIKTPDGKNVFKMTSGLAILYAPFFFAAHLIALVTKYPANGFSEPYKVLLLISSLFYMIIGLLYTRKLLLKLKFKENDALITLVLIIFGTNLLAYSTIESPMPHVYSFCIVAMFIYYFLNWLDKSSIQNSIRIGILFGIIVLIRPSDIVIAVVPIILGIRKFTDKSALLRIIFISIPSFFLIWLPQFIYWKYTTGQFLFYSYTEESFDFLHPHILEGLFSFRKGWLIYTPIMFFAIIGIYFLGKNLKSYILPVTLFILVNVYVIFSWWCWWYGGSLGMRPMIDSYSIMAIPLAAFVEKTMQSQKYFKIPLILIGAFLIWLNIFQIFQYKNSSLHYDSMTMKLYFKQFGIRDQIPGFENYLDAPDYKAYLKGNTENKDDNSSHIMLKAYNGKFLGVSTNRRCNILANFDSSEKRADLILVELEDNLSALKSFQHQFVCPELNEENQLTATRQEIGEWERFQIIALGENQVAIKASNHKFLSVNDTSLLIYAIKDTIGIAETFRLIRLNSNN